MTSRRREMLLKLAASLAAVTAAFLLAAIVVACFGASPLAFLRAYIRGAFGSRTAWVATASAAIPLAMAGLAVALPFRCGLFNVGAEGQLYMGGLAGILTAKAVAPLGAPWALALVLCAAALAGGLWAAPAIGLKLRTGAHEVVSSIMLNYVALGLVSYLVFGPLAESAGRGRTDPVVPVARMPLVAASGGMALSWGWLAPVALALLAAASLRYTRWGLSVRAVGAGSRAARASGVDTGGVRFSAFVIAGMVAGLAGGLVVTGRAPYALSPGFAAGYGYDGIIVAMLARANPLAAPVAACFIGSLYAADRCLQLQAGISRHIIYVVEGALLFCLAAGLLLERRRARRG